MALWEAILSIIMVVVTLGVMAFEVCPPDMAMMLCSLLFVCLQITSVKEATEGFSNSGMLTVATLFIVAQGLNQAGVLEWVTRFFKATMKYVSGHGLRPLIFHITIPMGIISAFTNNTPQVAMMIPVIIDYCEAAHIAPSKMLIPLSFSTIVGGTITLIGTSTNLIVVALAKKSNPDYEFKLFDIAPVGIPVMFSGVLYLALFSGRFLPDRMGTSEVVQNPREYLVEMMVAEDAPFVGKTIEDAGLRHVVGLFLVRVERENSSTPAPGPEFVLAKNDKLFFAGEVDSVLQLTNIRGLKLVDERDEEKDLHRLTRTEEMIEVVLSNSCPLVNKTVREMHFRGQYNAAIVAVHRAGERIHGRIGDIRLQASDTLLLVANKNFYKQYKKDKSFSLVARLSHFKPIQRRMAPIAVIIAITMIVLPAVMDDKVELVLTAMLTVAAYLALKILSPTEARQALELDILICIAASFGISSALVNSGGAKLVAQGLTKIAKPFGKPGFLTILYITTVLFSAVVTNNAAVAIMWPIAHSAMLKDKSLHVDEILIVLMMGAADYFTPIGYQTNMMVYGPGGYKFMDYVKFGGGMQIWLLVTTIPCIIFRKYWYAWSAFYIGLCIALFFWSIRGPKKAMTVWYPSNSSYMDTNVVEVKDEGTSEYGEDSRAVDVPLSTVKSEDIFLSEAQSSTDAALHISHPVSR